MYSLNKHLWKIALPIMLNMLVSNLQMVIDRAFLGQIDVTYMAALGNVMAPLWATIAFSISLTTGANVLMSQALGAGRPQRALRLGYSLLKFNSVLPFVFFLVWVFGARGIFTLMGAQGQVLEYAVSYTLWVSPMLLLAGINSAGSALFQVSSYTTPLLVAGVIRAGLNIIFDWLLIFGNLGFPELGLEGAAIATSIAEFGGALYLVGALIHGKGLFHKLSWRGVWTSKPRAYLAIMRKGLPAAGEETLWNAGNLALIMLMNVISMIAAGMHTVVVTVELFPLLVFLALGQSTLVLAGIQTGARNYANAQRVGRLALLYAWGLAAFCLFFFIVLPEPILGVFTRDAGVIEDTKLPLILVGISLFPRALNIVMGSGIRGFGDTKWMLMTQTFGTVTIVSVAAVLILGFQVGLVGVFITVVVDETIRALVNYWRYRKGPTYRAEHLVPVNPEALAVVAEATAAPHLIPTGDPQPVAAPLAVAEGTADSAGAAGAVPHAAVGPASATPGPLEAQSLKNDAADQSHGAGASSAAASAAKPREAI